MRTMTRLTRIPHIYSLFYIMIFCLIILLKLSSSLKPLIIDSFLYNGEIELLLLRLKVLGNIISHFVIIETECTFQGQFKNFTKNQYYSLENLPNHRLKKYPIIYRKLSCVNMMENLYNLRARRSQREPSWQYESITRNFISRVINESLSHLNYFVLLSDLDEIPFPKQILTSISKYWQISPSGITSSFHEDIVVLLHTNLSFIFNLNCRKSDSIWAWGPKLASLKTLLKLTPDVIRLDGLYYDSKYIEKSSTIMPPFEHIPKNELLAPLCRCFPVIIEWNGGAHLSSFLSFEKLNLKYNSFSHIVREEDLWHLKDFVEKCTSPSDSEKYVKKKWHVKKLTMFDKLLLRFNETLGH